jgi:hypothetical protein
MINIEKIKIYVRYQGDIDSWARGGSKKEQAIMSDADWYLIESLLQDIALVHGGYASLEFEKTVRERLNQNSDSVETIAYLEELGQQRDSFN